VFVMCVFMCEFCMCVYYFLSINYYLCVPKTSEKHVYLFGFGLVLCL
jgi:hypothetical protein